MAIDLEENSRTIRVLIVEDHPAIRQGLGLLLESEGICVCAEAGGRSEALSACQRHQPDVVLVDLSLGNEDGLVLLAELKDRDLLSLVYSMHEDGRHVKQALAAGARGYVTKREAHRVLVDAIHEIAGGRGFVSERAAVALEDYAGDDREETVCEALSPQEREVYNLVGAGETTKQIATAMQISARTVESYLERILVKLCLDGMHELRRHAIKHRRQAP